MEKILFVCTANVCRSPMAEAIFNALSEDGGLGLRAQSAGVEALKGAPTAPEVVGALAEIGICAEPRRARQVSEAMIEGADLVLAMTPQQAAELRRLFRDQSGKVHSLTQYVGVGTDSGVADPYGHTRVAYRASARQLLGYLERLVSRIVEEQQCRFDGSFVAARLGRMGRDMQPYSNG